MKVKKVPMRTCVVTHEKLEKKELLRVVRDNEGNVYNCEIKVISECTKSHQECETYTHGPRECKCEEHSGVERCELCYWTEEVCNKVCDRYIYK